MTNGWVSRLRRNVADVTMKEAAANATDDLMFRPWRVWIKKEEKKEKKAQKCVWWLEEMWTRQRRNTSPPPPSPVPARSVARTITMREIYYSELRG